MTTAAEKTAATLGAASAVTDLVGTRYWPDRADVDSPPTPYITFQVITELRNDHIDAPGKGKRCRVQINCYGASRAEADQLADKVEITCSQSGRIVFRQATYDFEAQLYWTQLDWSTSVLNPT